MQVWNCVRRVAVFIECPYVLYRIIIYRIHIMVFYVCVISHVHMYTCTQVHMYTCTHVACTLSHYLHFNFFPVCFDSYHWFLSLCLGGGGTGDLAA